MSEFPLTSKYAPVDVEQARKLGFETAEWTNVTESFGRAPNEFEVHLLLLARSDDITPRSGETFLRSVYRRNPNVVYERAGKVGAVDIGFGEAIVLGVESGTRAATRDPENAVRGAALGLAAEMRSIGTQIFGSAMNALPGDAESSRAHRFLQRSIKGAASATNSIGIPLVQENVFFHNRYDTLPLTDVAFCGIASVEKVVLTTKLEGKEELLYVGPKTVISTAGNRAPSRIVPADPVRLESAAEILSTGLDNKSVVALERIAGGGIVISAFRLATRLGIGLRIELDAIPIYSPDAVPEYAAEQALVSDSPGRFLVIASSEKVRELNEQCARLGMQALSLGEIIRERSVELTSQHRTMGAIPLDLISSQITSKSYDLLLYPPMLYRSAEQQEQRSLESRKKAEKRQHIEYDDRFLDFLANPNLCSRRDVLKSFDTTGGHSLLLGGRTDAAVYRIENSGSQSSSRPPRGLSFAMRSNPLYGVVDPYLAAVHAASSAMRAIATTGTLPVAAAQSLGYGDPTQYKQLSEFSEGTRGLSDACRAWQIPIVAEQVMFQPPSTTGAILPTPTICFAGVVSNLASVRPFYFNDRDEIILLLGSTEDELSASEYRAYFDSATDLPAPEINFATERNTCELVVELLLQGLLSSAHSVGSGGAAVALAWSCLSRPKPIGARLTLTVGADVPGESQLFGETSGRFLVSFPASNESAVTKIIASFGTPISGRGVVGGKEIILDGTARSSVPLSSASQIWNGGLSHVLRAA